MHKQLLKANTLFLAKKDREPEIFMGEWCRLCAENAPAVDSYLAAQIEKWFFGDLSNAMFSGIISGDPLLLKREVIRFENGKLIARCIRIDNENPYILGLYFAID